MGTDHLVVLSDRAEALSGGDERARARAAHEIATLRSASARPALVALLSDENERVRLEAAQALGRPGPGGAVGLAELQPLLDDPSPRVRQVAARMLETAARRQATRSGGGPGPGSER